MSNEIFHSINLLMLTKVISNSAMLSIIFLGSCISLIAYSPIENENKQLSINEKNVYKKITAILQIPCLIKKRLNVQ